MQSVATGEKELVLQLSTQSSKKPQGTITMKLDMYGSRVRSVPICYFIGTTCVLALPSLALSSLG